MKKESPLSRTDQSYFIFKWAKKKFHKRPKIWILFALRPIAHKFSRYCKQDLLGKVVKVDIF